MKILNLLLIVILNISSPFFSVYGMEYAAQNGDCCGPNLEFENYPSEKKSFKKAKNIDLNSYKDAKRFKTVLKEGFKKDPNFAQYLTIVEVGCGTMCQSQWVIDSRTGKIIDCFQTEFGAKFQLDSNLLVLNPVTNEDIKEAADDVPTAWKNVETIYQVFDNKKFKIIKKEKVFN